MGKQTQIKKYQHTPKQPTMPRDAINAKTLKPQTTENFLTKIMEEWDTQSTCSDARSILSRELDIYKKLLYSKIGHHKYWKHGPKREVDMSTPCKKALLKVPRAKPGLRKEPAVNPVLDTTLTNLEKKWKDIILQEEGKLEAVERWKKMDTREVLKHVKHCRP